mmetsp:Transcript_84324/g.247328  ORF Transcript_84324/g.247328 Transcript_84324/m.247328 type:complete len:231 (+) Transcript_84324:93-785(+)
MGSVSRLQSTQELAKEPVRLLLTGLDAVGKTTILRKIKRPEDKIVTTISTIGFNLETMRYDEISFTTWGVSGRDKSRPLSRRVWQGVHGIIFVVDSSDHDRVEHARQELHQMLGEEDQSEVVLLVFANKQDLPNAMNVPELTEKLGLSSLEHRQWHIQSSCAVSGDGLSEGLDWLSCTIPQQRAGHKFKTNRSTKEFPVENRRLWSGPWRRLQAMSSSNLTSSKFLPSLA